MNAGGGPGQGHYNKNKSELRKSVGAGYSLDSSREGEL